MEKSYKRLVVKVGTNLLSGARGLDRQRIRALAAQIASLQKTEHQVVLVTSGAIGAGISHLGLARRPSHLPEKQAAAAIGQVLLMEAYEQAFSKHRIVIAQILLTRSDLDDRQRYLNARNTLLNLLHKRAVPIVNENDTVAVEEIQFGDNDTLAAVVATKVDADLVVLLTDVEGLYSDVQQKTVIPEVFEISEDIERMAGTKAGALGVGGMHTKIQAARIATASGIPLVIANGIKNNVLVDIVQGKSLGTYFHPKESPLQSRKRWIAFGATIRGKVLVDAGAVRALKEQGGSLLPSGITAVEGQFQMGDTISVIDPEGREVARGMTFFSEEEVKQIKGKKSQEISQILGRSDYTEIIHRDNLVLL